MSLLEAAEEAVAIEVTRRVCCGAEVAVAAAKTETHHVVGFAQELRHHPCGVRDIPPPVVVSFQLEHWARISHVMHAIWRTP